MPGDSKSKILRDAERFVLQGKTTQAISEYLKVIKSDPRDVMTLNIVGDLYLRQKKTSEANSYFSQVAESYARENFLLKAIAVYKKILSIDPANIDINLKLASLFAKQGLVADARDRFLHLADLHSREGRRRETVEAYEKAVELDPANAPLQLKLAQMLLAEGAKERALTLFAGAARAQVKAGDLAGAMSSYRSGLDLSPADAPLLRDYLQASTQFGEVSDVRAKLEKLAASFPQSLDFQEMLGKACLAAGDLEAAAGIFTLIARQDEPRSSLFFALQDAHLRKGDLEAATACLDEILPELIRQRLSDRVVAGYQAILKANPGFEHAWMRLARIYSDTNDLDGHIAALDGLAGCQLEQRRFQDALETLERILHLKPGGQKHLELHRQTYVEAFPGEPYVSPFGALARGAVESSCLPPDERHETRAASPMEAVPSMVEVDLLLNYGMAEKALEILQAMRTEDPSNKEVHQKFIAVYREQHKLSSAAEHCLLLAIEYRKSGDNDAAQKWLAEAGRLDPALVQSRQDLVRLASKPPEMVHPDLQGFPTASTLEFDLSGDLSDIMFRGDSIGDRGTGGAGLPDESAAEFSSTVTPRPPLGSLDDQLQEVDFYIRLGFSEEARTKLDELARSFPDSPEVEERYRQIDKIISECVLERPDAQDGTADSVQVIALGGGEAAPEGEPAPSLILSVDELDTAVPQAPKGTPAPAITPGERRIPADEAAEGAEVGQGTTGIGDSQPKQLFEDLLRGLDFLTDRQIAREDFETHFSLGIAYREMELVDDAIREFQSAIKALDPAQSPRETIQSCGMLSTCFLEKRMAKSAIRWCISALAVPGISPHEETALRYDIGVAFDMNGEPNRALDYFELIAQTDPGYRDVARRIEELKSGPGRHAS